MASFNQSPIGQATLSTGLATALAPGSLTVINVTSSGAAAFVVNGVSNPTLYLVRGNRYSIVVNAPGHPFWIQTVSGPLDGASTNVPGITNNGTDNGTITFDVPISATQLYYVCQNHAAMAGSISISSTVNDAAVINIDFNFIVDSSNGTPTWFAPSSSVQSEGRRESKMIGLPPSPGA